MPVGYGKKIRQQVRKAEEKSRKRYKCPACSRVSVKRVSPGIWQCRKCNSKFASGSFEFKE